MTFEWCIATKSGSGTFSTKRDSGRWAYASRTLFAKIMGQFGGNQVLKLSVLSPMNRCMERLKGFVGEKLRLV